MTAAAVIVTVGVLPISPAMADDLSDEAAFVARINDLRASQGLPALALDAGLSAKAEAWARTMAQQNTIWHSKLSDGITANWRKLGENVGMGGSVDGLHIAFVNSPHHYDNLVDRTFTSIGLGVVRNDRGTIFVAEEFMQAAPTPPPVAAAPAKPAAASPAKARARTKTSTKSRVRTRTHRRFTASLV